MQQMAVLKISKLDLWFEASLRKKELIMMRFFALVARYTSIRIIISLASVFDWKLYQLDVKIAFLNGEVEQEVYIEQP
jgi:hypothetical protein